MFSGWMAIMASKETIVVEGLSLFGRKRIVLPYYADELRIVAIEKTVMPRKNFKNVTEVKLERRWEGQRERWTTLFAVNLVTH